MRFHSNNVQDQSQQEEIDPSLLSNHQDHGVQQHLDEIDQLILEVKTERVRDPYVEMHGNFYDTRTVKELTNKDIRIKVSRKYYYL